MTRGKSLFDRTPKLKTVCRLTFVNLCGLLIDAVKDSEITEHAVGARKRKLIEDFKGIQGNDSKFTACRCTVVVCCSFSCIQK